MKITFLFALIFYSISSNAQSVIPLYKSVPNQKKQTSVEVAESGTDGVFRISKVTEPTLTVFVAKGQSKQSAAVIICPGGGYTILAFEKEGIAIAKEFNKHGITAFVLKYRLPDSLLQVNREIVPLQDIQQAIKVVRSGAPEWEIDPEKIGVMGFSAGGHLAASAGTQYKNIVIDNAENVSLKPSFLILAYPVISFSDSIGHKGSRNRLLGQSPSLEKINSYSNELLVNTETPPTFLVHAGDDKTVKVANSLRFYEALQKNGVAAELHIYPKGGHGFGLNNKYAADSWFERCINWMKSAKLISVLN